MTYDGVYDRDENEREQESWEEPTGDVPYLPEGLHDDEQPWRGLEHPVLPGWPQEEAGPEYWLYLSDSEDEDNDATGKQ